MMGIELGQGEWEVPPGRKGMLHYPACSPGPVSLFGELLHHFPSRPYGEETCGQFGGPITAHSRTQVAAADSL